jgi:cyclic pyranopterin phosphate synthase
MEVQAAIEALFRIKPGSQATLYSDSLYLVNTMTKGWKRRVNNDLWDRLDSLVAKRDVRFKWVKGHAGHPVQELADQLASAAAELTVAGGAPEPGEQPRLSHLDDEGQARMVDISSKVDTERVALARGRVAMQPATLELIRNGKAAKGDVLSVARIAGVMGAKKTSDLIPLTHTLLITEVAVDFDLNDADSAVEITATARTTGKTGVEMEAMTAVSVSALTIYDMCKAVDRGIRIEAIRLVRKSGGKSGDVVLE